MLDLINISYYDLPPANIHVCQCSQCKAAKNTTGNRRSKKKVKRILNKLMRSKKQVGKHITYYWA